MAAKSKTVYIVGFIAVALAAAASIVLYNYLKGQETMVQKAVASEKIVVAAVEVPVGANITSTQIRMQEWPTASKPQGAFSSSDAVAGRVALEKFVSGEPIVEAKLVPKEGGGGILTFKIPEGHRAMTVAVDQVSGVAGFITPGSMVDVVLTVTVPGGQQPISKIVLQNVPVLAIAQTIEQQKDGKAIVVPTVTMDVTPEDAEKLAIASTQGRLNLVLRRLGDKEVAKTSGTTVSKVVSGGVVASSQTTAAKPAKKAVKKAAPKVEKVETPPPTVEKPVAVEVYRATQKSVETFKSEK